MARGDRGIGIAPFRFDGVRMAAGAPQSGTMMSSGLGVVPVRPEGVLLSSRIENRLGKLDLTAIAPASAP
jgi:hypothetical protein